MSILIKDMEIPTSCHACCFFGQADIWESDFDGYTKSFCKRTGSQTFDYVDKFLPNCPLVPVPPHGRLIDADDAYHILTNYYHHSTELQHYELREALARVSTIIPAEEATQMDGGQDD